MAMANRQYALDFPHRAAYGREDFLIAPCNEAAVKWIDLWPDWPAPALVLYGEAASGKTHLSYVWQERVDALRLPAQDLVGADFSRIFTKAKAVIIEDADVSVGDLEIEKALFHLYNMAKEEQAYILLTASTVPSSWQFQLPDLRSRLLAAPSVSIYAPDDTLLNAILVKMFMDRQLVVNEDVLNYITPRVERSFSFVRQLVEKADKIALAEKKGITIPVIRQALEQM